MRGKAAQGRKSSPSPVTDGFACQASDSLCSTPAEEAWLRGDRGQRGSTSSNGLRAESGGEGRSGEVEVLRHKRRNEATHTAWFIGSSYTHTTYIHEHKYSNVQILHGTHRLAPCLSSGTLILYPVLPHGLRGEGLWELS